MARMPLQSISAAMRRNSDMRVFFGSGIYDLVTTNGYVRHVLLEGVLSEERVVVKEYESGHMPYLGEKSAASLTADLRAFIISDT